MLNSKNYKEVLSKEGKSILLISGPGCANCIAMYPIVNDFINNIHKYYYIILKLLKNIRILLKIIV